MSLYGGITIPGQPDLENVRKLDLLPVDMVRKMQRLGIAIDVPYLQDFSAELGRDMAGLEREIAGFIPVEALHQFSQQAAEIEEVQGEATINANSAVQIRALLFGLLQVGRGRDLKTTANGEISTGKKQLELCRDEHPVVHKVLQYRERSKLKSAFADALPKRARYHPKGECPVCELEHVEATWRVHTEFMMTRTETGRFSSKNPNCFDAKTELLTEHGWVRFDRYKQHHNNKVKVAQWNEDGSIEFVIPSGYVESEGREFVHLSNQHIDLCLTPDHRCLLIDRKSKELKVVRAEDYLADAHQINAGIWGGGEGLNLTDAEIRLLVALQADASFAAAGRVDLSVSKTRKKERIAALLAECGIEFKRKTDERRTRFYFSAPKLFALLGQEKKYGSYLLRLTRHQIDVFLSEVMFWDGCWTRSNHYSTTVKDNADWVQILYSLSGRRAVVREYAHTYNDRGIWAWNVDVTKHDYSHTANITRTKEAAKRTAYCVSVPSSFLVVRRSGRVMVTGNCQQIPARTELGARVRNAFVASPGTRLVSSDFSQIELRDLAHMAKAKSMIEVYERDGDIHEFTAMQAFAITDATKVDKLRHRLPCKTVNFGIVYGMQGLGLQAQLAVMGLFWTEEECNDFIGRWFDLYPEVRSYMELQYYRARRYGYVWDVFGRVRRVPETRSCHPYVRSAGLRQAGNMPIQAASAGQTKLVMGELDQDFGNIYSDGHGIWVWPLLTIHDQLVAEVEEAAAEDIRDIMMDRFSQVMVDKETGENLWRVPVKSDGEILTRWKKE